MISGFEVADRVLYKTSALNESKMTFGCQRPEIPYVNQTHCKEPIKFSLVFEVTGITFEEVHRLTLQ